MVLGWAYERILYLSQLHLKWADDGKNLDAFRESTKVIFIMYASRTSPNKRFYFRAIVPVPRISLSMERVVPRNDEIIYWILTLEKFG